MPLYWIDGAHGSFPPVDKALVEPNGLLAAGGDLSLTRLLDAYSHGIFPWYEAGQPVLWWSPDPRMVLLPGQMKISRSLARLIHRNVYKVTMDEAFRETVSKCATARRKSNGTWITPEMQFAYGSLHDAGYAHSVEVWKDGQLVGGLYGVALGKIFFGESMFSILSNTSKLALAHLMQQLRIWDFKLVDCQVSSAHLQSLGAVEISRSEFLQYLHRYLEIESSPDKWQLQSVLNW